MAANGLKVLRQVDGLPSDIQRNLEVDDRALIYFDDGTIWVDNDRPWDAVSGAAIVKHTVAFQVTNADHERLAGPYRALDKALAARDGAKVQIVSIVEDLEPEAFDTAAASA